MGEMYDDSLALQRLEGIDMRQPEDAVAPMVRVLTMIRNRDMLLCYLRHRMERIEVRWHPLAPRSRERERPDANYSHARAARWRPRIDRCACVRAGRSCRARAGTSRAHFRRRRSRCSPRTSAISSASMARC